MFCSNCGREVSDSANFCRSCGAAQAGGPTPEDRAAGQATPAEAGAASTTEQPPDAVTLLQTQLNHLTARVSALEARPAAPPSAAPNAPAEPRAAVNPAVAPTPTAGSPTALTGSGSPPTAQPAAGSPTGGFPPDQRVLVAGSGNWEWLVGGNWLARIGILALIIGIGFFLRLAFENQWIGETGRVILGLAAGLLLLAAGDFWRRKYALWAQATTGGGIAILYLSIFAAFSLYDLLPAPLALGFSFLVTLTAAGLSLRYESRTIAVLGILGGFATPLLLAEKLPQQWALLGYVLILDLGVLALAALRNWRWFTLLALGGSLLLFLFWKAELEPPLALAQVAITVIFLIFVGATTLFHLIWQRPPRVFDQALMVLNAAAYLILSYWQLFEDFRVWMGGFTVLLAAFYGLLSYGILRRHREQVCLSLFAIGIALVLLSIAVPVQLDGPWIAPAWAIEGVVLVWLSFFLRMPELRWFGLAAFAATLGGLLIEDAVRYLDIYSIFDPERQSGWLGLSAALLSDAIVIAAVYATAFLWWRNREERAYQWDAIMPAVFLVAANGITLWALSLLVIDTVNLAADGGQLPRHLVGNIVSLSLSGLWGLYAAFLIVLGIMRQAKWLRLGGLALLGIPILKLFIYDSFELDQGYRVAAFIGLGALLVIGGFLYQRHSRAIRGFLLE